MQGTLRQILPKGGPRISVSIIQRFSWKEKGKGEKVYRCSGGSTTRKNAIRFAKQLKTTSDKMHYTSEASKAWAVVWYEETPWKS